MSIYQKKIESEKLNNDVEKWLANNSIKELPIGFTHFPDGVIPTKPGKAAQTEAERIEKERLTKEKNDLVKKQKEEQRAAQRAEAYQRKLQYERDKRAKKRAELLAREAANQTKLQQLIDKHTQPKVSKLKLVTFVPWTKHKGLCEIGLMRKRDAELRGDMIYLGYCSKHKETDFKITTHGGRCVTCIKERNASRRRQEYHPEAARKKTNKALRITAIKEGKPSFIGQCPHHGSAEYKVYPATNTARCIQCEAVKKQNYVRVEVDARIQANRDARELAISQGKKEFTGECARHGKTVFRVNLQTHYMFCVECRRETQREALRVKREKRLATDQEARKKLDRIASNQKARDEAIEKGEKTFMGECSNHGVTTYSISRECGKVVIKCRKCRTKTCTNNMAKNQEHRLNHPRNVAVIQYFERVGKDKMSKVAKEIGISPALVSQWFTGRLVITEANFEKFSKVTGVTL